MIVPETLRAGWPHKELQVMQTVDELKVQLMNADQQPRAAVQAAKAAIQAAETGFVERMLQHQQELKAIQVLSLECGTSKKAPAQAHNLTYFSISGTWQVELQ